ncbi:MAG: valine--tRNA ligase, partial [Actinomycetota bacterium]
AASGRPGTDTAFDVGQMKIGRRLATKILNASKFTLMQGSAPASAISNPLDKALLAALADVVDESTKAFEQFNYTKALEVAETFFWAFCDDHLEIVKDRAYGLQGEAESASAKATLNVALEVLLKLFAPFLPFVTEEVWSWFKDGSIHTSSWPTSSELRGGDAGLNQVTAEVISLLRKVKSEAKVSMKAEISKAVITAPSDVISQIKLVAADLRAAGRVTTDFQYAEGASPISIEIELAPTSD